MARSHHRKKHKEHLRQFKQSQERDALLPASSRTNAAVLLGILGALVGIAVGYFATYQLLWTVIGLAIGAAIGHFIGRKADRAK